MQQTDTITPLIYLTPQCAWCNEEQGQPQGDGSHGICKHHAEEQYQQYKASRTVYGTCGHIAKSENHTCGAWSCIQQYGF